MRILQAHKFFYRRGGAEAVFLDTIAGLRERGHEVAEFSMQHPKNLPSDYNGYFVSELPELGKKQTWGEAFKVFSHLFIPARLNANCGLWRWPANRKWLICTMFITIFRPALLPRLKKWAFRWS